MVLDLVVQPAVHEIVDVAPGAKVRRADNCSHVKVVRSRFCLGFKSVNVVTDVVRRDHDERVQVGEQIRQ